MTYSCPRRRHRLAQSLKRQHERVVGEGTAAVRRHPERLLALRTLLLTAGDRFATEVLQTRAAESVRARQTFGVRQFLVTFPALRHGVVLDVIHT